MPRRFGFALVWALITLLIVAGVGAFAYHLGTLATVAAAGDGAYVVHPYYGAGFGFFPFFGLFPLFGFLFFLLVLFWIFGGRRRWYGGWYGGGPGPHGARGPYGPGGHGGQSQAGVPPFFEEWHRRAHGEAASPATPDQPTTDEPRRQA